MPQYDNYDVWIRVEGKRLPEYAAHYSGVDQTEITCWIPSEVGKTFEICYNDSIRAFATRTSFSVDGNRCSGRILYSRQTKPLRPDTIIKKGQAVSNHSFRPFVFSNCELTDDDGFISSSADPGQITICVNKVAVGEDSATDVHFKPFPKPKVHERAKKGIVHGIQLGPECPRQSRRAPVTRVIQHLVTFKFKYRPLDTLQADGIAPRSTPSNANVTLDRNAGRARIQALKEELRVLEARQHQKKRKRSESKPLLSKAKRERSFTLDNNVIDLT